MSLIPTSTKYSISVLARFAKWMDTKAKSMHVISPNFLKVILFILKPKGYNTPWNFRMLYNQWLHQGFLWGYWSYEFHASHLEEVIEKEIE